MRCCDIATLLPKLSDSLESEIINVVICSWLTSSNIACFAAIMASKPAVSKRACTTISSSMQIFTSQHQTNPTELCNRKLVNVGGGAPGSRPSSAKRPASAAAPAPAAKRQAVKQEDDGDQMDVLQVACIAILHNFASQLINAKCEITSNLFFTSR